MNKRTVSVVCHIIEMLKSLVRKVTLIPEPDMEE